MHGDVEAKIIAIACSQPPKGHSEWTLRLISERVVELNIFESISHMLVGRILKNEFKPHLKQMWCILPKQNADFVAHMEDVLDVYLRPYGPAQPVICMDERETIPMPATNHTEK
jgi:hypothetical protein